MKADKILYFLAALGFFVIGVVLSKTYRQYIYASGINDFHLADTIGSLVAVPACVCFYYSVSNSNRKLEYVVGITIIAFILYELLGLFGLHGCFDIFDIIATLLSGIITYIVLSYIQK